MEPRSESKLTTAVASEQPVELPINNENSSDTERTRPSAAAAAAAAATATTTATTRESVEEWRSLVVIFRKPLVTILQPLHVFIKAKFCDPDAQALQEQLLELHDRNVEASEKLLNWLTDEQDRSVEDLLVRWRSFESAVKAVHPIIYEILFEGCDVEIQEHQKNLLNYFMDDIIQSVDAQSLLPRLYSRGLLNEDCCQRLGNLYETKGPTVSAIYMVCNIHRLRSDWYEVFLELLVDDDNGKLVKSIDDKEYDRIKRRKKAKYTKEAQTSSTKEEACVEVYGAAYDPSPGNYAAVPTLGKTNDEPVSSDDNGPRSEEPEDRKGHADPEETEVKSTLYRMSTKYSAYGDELIALGEKSTYVTVSKWKNEPVIHIRKYAVMGEDEKLYPTKKGICLNQMELDGLITAMDKIKKKVKALKKQ